MNLKVRVLIGFEATQIIKKEKPGLPVIAMTAYHFSGVSEKRWKRNVMITQIN
jgi:CheY-like chemotaxis protein